MESVTLPGSDSEIIKMIFNAAFAKAEFSLSL